MKIITIISSEIFYGIKGMRLMENREIERGDKQKSITTYPGVSISKSKR
jgi:hypothetical protein